MKFCTVSVIACRVKFQFHFYLANRIMVFVFVWRQFNGRTPPAKFHLINNVSSRKMDSSICETKPQIHKHHQKEYWFRILHTRLEQTKLLHASNSIVQITHFVAKPSKVMSLSIYVFNGKWFCGGEWHSLAFELQRMKFTRQNRRPFIMPSFGEFHVRTILI